jgi:hypothetical protein
VDRPWFSLLDDLGWIGLGFGLVTSAAVAYFAAHGALHDLRLATVDYNLGYSNETYEGPVTVLGYVLTFPVERARVDPLWFVGGLGALLVAGRAGRTRSALVVLGWLLAAVLSIAINGSRSLPNYFVQANPALALAGSLGLALGFRGGRRLQYAIVAILLAALWRVGTDRQILGWRFASLPGLVENVAYDLRQVLGRTDRDTYLARFEGQKYHALEIERLVRHVRSSTGPADPIFVFGFSGGSVAWRSGRTSSSRFFWSRPVIVGFASEQPGYGVDGLLDDLRRSPPAAVALQKEEWRSYEFFMSNESLRAWLERGYVLDHETPEFSVWRPRP